MVGRKRRIMVERVYDLKTGGRAEGHAHGHGAVHFDHRRRREFHQLPVKARDPPGNPFPAAAYARAWQAAISAWSV
jgi:hypothetical protein